MVEEKEGDDEGYEREGSGGGNQYIYFDETPNNRTHRGVLRRALLLGLTDLCSISASTRRFRSC